MKLFSLKFQTVYGYSKDAYVKTVYRSPLFQNELNAKYLFANRFLETQELKKKFYSFKTIRRMQYMYAPNQNPYGFIYNCQSNRK
jgi:hypothetical protein